MKIVVLTSNSYAWLLPAFAYCLNKHWPGKPAVDVVHYDVQPRALSDNFQTTGLGAQKQLTWSGGFVSYLSSIRDEIILLLLEDYFFVEPVNVEALQAIYAYMEADPAIAKIELSPHRLAYATDGAQGTVGAFRMMLSGAETLFQACIQAAFWRRETLLTFLDPHEDAWQFETQGTQRMIEARRLGLWSGLILLTDPPILNYENAVRGSWGRSLSELDAQNIRPELRQELTAAGVLG